MVYQLLYQSRANVEISSLILANIADIAEAHNARMDITGVLLHNADRFVQLLEGRKEQVEALMHGIRRDYRHRNVEVIETGLYTRRSFPDWSMLIVNEDDAAGEGLLDRAASIVSAAGLPKRTPLDSFGFALAN